MSWLECVNWNAVSAASTLVTAIAAVAGLFFIYKQLAELTLQEERQNDELRLNHYSEIRNATKKF
jgi:hypothetical protein